MRLTLRLTVRLRDLVSRLGHLAVAAAMTTALAAVVAPIAMVATAPPAQAIDNGLAKTPQMGWNDWNAYGCNVSDSLIRSTASAMHNNGMQAAGYQYVNIDDCWMTRNRDSSGNLVPDPNKFPNGIKALADYVHSLGLKLGIYEDAGTATCAGYPGSLNHERQDANLFASWGIDYLKYDNCNNQGVNAQSRYTAMRDALAATGRPILYSICSWGQDNVWTWGAGVGNSWRTTGDIANNYTSMLNIFHANVGLASYAGPGAWNDPDMLEVGNGMSATEDRAHFSLWAQMAAPLVAGNNIPNASATTVSILTNTRVIAVDQDSLGKQGRMVSSSSGRDVLAKPLANGDVSVVLFNEGSSTATISTTAAAIGKTGASSYTLTDLWTGGTSTTTGTISASVPAHGVVMYRVAGGSTGGGDPVTGPVRAVGAGKCLDVASATAGNQARIEPCGGQTGQTWTYTTGNQLSVYNGSMCLDAYDNQTSPGTKVVIWSCNGQSNQQWLRNSDGTFTGVQSGLCLDVTGASTADGALVVLWTCNGQSNQRWTLSTAAATATATATATSLAATQGPCDLYSSGGTPCVAAHSTTRALYGSYNGALYQVRRSSDNTTRDVGVLEAGGIANAATQDSFCAGTSCVITIIYDQSGRNNRLTQAPPGGFQGPAPGGYDNLANATSAPITVGGHKAYGVFVAPGTGYRNNNASGTATGDQAEGMYAIFDGTHYNGGCCFDYGNAETNSRDNGNGTMEAIYFGNIKVWGYGTGNGPWIMADLENGLFSGVNAGYNANDPSISHRFLTTVLKGESNHWAIRGGNAQSGGLSTFYDGRRPNVSGYNPMKKEGAIILGTGGDNSIGSAGTFYEGVMTSGYPSDATENAVQANITAAGYGSGGTGTTTGPLHAVGAGKCLDLPNSTTTLGTQLQTYSCNGAANQSWTRTSSNQLTVTVGGTTLCLDANGNGTSAGTKVVTWSCNGQTNQQWTVNSNGTVTGAQSGLCLDVTGASTANGALVELWTCNGGSNQQWTLG